MVTKPLSIAVAAFAVALNASAAQAGGDYSWHRDHDSTRDTNKQRLRAGVAYGGQHRSHHGAPRYHTGTHGGPYAGRTEFCRYEDRIGVYSGRRVEVKRCIWVRNDLLGVYAGDGWVRH